MTPEPPAAGPSDLTLAPEAAPTKAPIPEPEHESDGDRRFPRWLAAFGVTRLSAVYLWALFIALYSIIIPSTFLTSTTFRLVFSQGVTTCLLALAFLIPLAAGAYDLSIGALMSLALGISVFLQIHTGLPPGLGAVVAIAACALVGCVNGFVVVRLRVNSFIATLATSQVLLAAVLLMSKNQDLVATFPSSWSAIGNNDFLGVPTVVWILLVIALLLWYLLEFTRAGRYLFATGGNLDAARLSGVKTNRMTWGSFVVSGLICGVAGVIYSMQTGLFSSTTGPGYLFPAVAAVFLGASQFSHRPNVWGALIAYFALAFGVQGLVLSASSVSAWSQPLFQGVSLIIAVSLASRPAVRTRRATRKSEPDAGR
jgi:ribose transport system permease protein